MNATNAITRKSINFNKVLERQIKREADKLGFSFGDFVRYTVAKAVEKSNFQNYDDLGVIPKNVETRWTKETNKIIEEIKKGKRNPHTNLKEYMKKLDDRQTV